MSWTPTPSPTTTQYFASNTRISFLPGVHKIDRVSVFYIKMFQMLPLLDTMCPAHMLQPVQRLYTHDQKLEYFFIIVNLVMMHLSIVYCGSPVYLAKDGREIIAAVYMKDIISLKL